MLTFSPLWYDSFRLMLILKLFIKTLRVCITTTSTQLTSWIIFISHCHQFGQFNPQLTIYMSTYNCILVLVSGISILHSGDVIIVLTFCLAAPLQLAKGFHQLGQQLHQVVWGSDLGKMLLDVPNCGGLRYIQSLKKPSQCFAILERLTRHKSNKLSDILKIIYVIV
jgi:hypothetical protein